MVGVTANRARDAAGDDRATTPTIGAVLLVGITMVLASTVGMYVFGFADTGQQPFATATVSYDADADRVTATWRANTNAETVVVKIRVGDHRRTVALNHVGQRVTVDVGGTTVYKSSVVRWRHPSATDGDEVSVTVVGTANGNTAVLVERTGTI